MSQPDFERGAEFYARTYDFCVHDWPGEIDFYREMAAAAASQGGAGPVRRAAEHPLGAGRHARLQTWREVRPGDYTRALLPVPQHSAGPARSPGLHPQAPEPRRDARRPPGPPGRAVAGRPVRGRGRRLQTRRATPPGRRSATTDRSSIAGRRGQLACTADSVSRWSTCSRAPGMRSRLFTGTSPADHWRTGAQT